MIGPKLDTTGADSPEVANKRNVFDRHLDRCTDCQPALCWVAQGLWREVCLSALRARNACQDGS